ncbi:hypothetical protein ACFQY0_20785, partial [Haloferula chungangensis]
VWGFFAESVSESLETRRAALETHQENYGESRKAASGIPLWPSRDPIEESGGVNLYTFVKNRPLGLFDWLGLSDSKMECSSKDHLGNFKELSFDILVETLANQYPISDPVSQVRDAIEGFLEDSQNPEGDSPLEKLEKFFGERVKSLQNMGVLLNVAGLLKELESGVLLETYKMEASMMCCVCESEEEGGEKKYFWKEVHGEDNALSIGEALTKKSGRQRVADHIRDVSVSVAKQLAKECPKEE